jgi:NitT/TauT family transport system permease protein
MSQVPSELRDDIPTFEKTEAVETSAGNWSALGTAVHARGAAEISAIVALAVAVFFAVEGLLRLFDVPDYVFPLPTSTIKILVSDFGTLYAPHLWVTLQTFLIGFAIGSTIGLVLAALITQKPFVEKIVAPYVIALVVTPMIALVPFLRLSIIKGFSIWPIVVAVALASGPMVLINSATGFRRTDLAKIALARSYGASTFQIFRKIRFPLALPMIIVGYMVGSIFGLLTAIGGEMVAASERGGLGRQLIYFSSLIQMDAFGGVILLLAALGVLIYVIFFFIGKRWASWEA